MYCLLRIIALVVCRWWYLKGVLLNEPIAAAVVVAHSMLQRSLPHVIVSSRSYISLIFAMRQTILGVHDHVEYSDETWSSRGMACCACIFGTLRWERYGSRSSLRSVWPRCPFSLGRSLHPIIDYIDLVLCYWACVAPYQVYL